MARLIDPRSIETSFIGAGISVNPAPEGRRMGWSGAFRQKLTKGSIDAVPHSLGL